MKLLTTRHAQTTYNRWGRLNSDPRQSVSLTARGQAQARALARQLEDASYDVVITSELPRTQQTAKVLNQRHAKPVIIEPLFNDIRTGFEGWPAIIWLAWRWLAGPQRSFGDGESLSEANARVLRGLNKLTQTDYQSVLVVAHRHTIDVFQQHFKGAVTPSRNAELHVFETTPRAMINAENTYD